jgi:CRISPR system Cascade subunit CasE
MHRTLSRAVSQALAEGSERLLFRLEPTPAHERPVVLVQTLSLPDWGVLGAGYAEVHPPKPFRPVLRPGQRLAFRLRANPAKRARETGKRVALKTREEKLAWLSRRLEEGGFRLLEGEVLQDVFLEVPKAGHRVQVQAVLFEGLLEVREPEKALETLRQGVGPGKALGLGLLSVKRT